jgi:NADH-quinone oxidoreductase subunit H
METVFQHPLFAPLVITLAIIAAFPLVAGYIVLVERKVLADFQVRLGPMRVGPHGLLQPIADALKLRSRKTSSPPTRTRPFSGSRPASPPSPR